MGRKLNWRNGDAKAQNGANYDEAHANPYPNLPDVMELAGGEQVATREQWKSRRAEIVELLEREVYGRIPGNVPGVKWEVRETREIQAGSIIKLLESLNNRRLAVAAHGSGIPGQTATSRSLAIRQILPEAETERFDIISGLRNCHCNPCNRSRSA